MALQHDLHVNMHVYTTVACHQAWLTCEHVYLHCYGMVLWQELCEDKSLLL